jgi:hypothetical protein
MGSASKVGFIVLAHNNVEQFGNLIRCLIHERVRIVVHVDSSADQAPFEWAVADLPVEFCLTRFASSWGSFNLVRATLAGISHLSSDPSIQRITLLSGSCMPLIRMDAMLDFFDKRLDTSFISTKRLSGKGSSGLDRVQRVWIRWGENRHQVNALPRGSGWEAWSEFHLYLVGMARVLYNLKFSALRQIIQYRSGVPMPDLEFRIGSQWWSLPRCAMDAIANRLEQDPSLEEFFETTWIPDEIFFQTLFHEVNVGLNLKVVPSPVYVSWAGETKDSPEFLDDREPVFFEQLVEQGFLFCRKFNHKRNL